MPRQPPRPPRVRPGSSSSDRGQAFTLEGFIAALVLLMAVLLAVQSVVITPSTGGAVDRTAQAQVQQQVQDALIVAQQTDASDGGNLSTTLRNIDLNETENGEYEFQEFHNASGAQGVYSPEVFRNESALGAILDTHLDAGQSYNVELYYQNESGTIDDPIQLVNQGPPSSTAVTASYTVTLHGNQTVTSPDHDDDDVRLQNVSDTDESYIPNLNDPDAEGEAVGVYNVVEVRVIVW